jgi:O-antigen/teichoic acid export membrane protein
VLSAVSAERSATVARGATVSLVGHLAGRGLGFVVTLVVTRWLGASDFGLFLLALSILQTARLFADLGLQDGALRFVALAEGRGDRAESARVVTTVLRWSLATSLIAAVVLMLAAPLLAQWFRQPALRWIIPILAVGLPLWTVGLVLRKVLQAFKRLVAIACLYSVIDPVIRIAVFIGCSLAGWRIGAALASHVLAAAVILIGALVVLRPRWPGGADRLRGRASRAILAFSIPLSLMQLAGLALQSADSLFLGYFTSAHSVGVYGAAERLAALGGMMLVAASMAFAPHATELYGQGRLEAIQRLYEQVTRWLIVLSLPIFALTVVFAGPLLALFGREFRDGWIVLVVLAVGVFVTVATGPAGDVVMMTGRSRVVLVVGILTSVLNVGLQWALVPRLGMLGAALATAGTFAVSNVTNVVVGWRLARLQPYSRPLLRPVAIALGAIAATAAVGVAVGTDSFSGGILILATWMVAYPVLVLQMGVASEDRGALRALLSRSRVVAPRWSEGT